jgi:5-formyltetrahydrofolate cyclo-ligase
MDLDSKESIRSKIIAKRKFFDNNLYREANLSISENLSQLISELPCSHKEVIALYQPLRGEPDLVNLSMPSDSIIAFPKIIGSEMIFVESQSNSEIIPRLIIVPGLCFSRAGYRIGFGQGYYDKYLNKISQTYQQVTIGVCFHDNLFEIIPHEIHDYQMDYIITDQVRYDIKPFRL